MEPQTTSKSPFSKNRREDDRGTVAHSAVAMPLFCWKEFAMSDLRQFLGIVFSKRGFVSSTLYICMSSLVKSHWDSSPL